MQENRSTKSPQLIYEAKVLKHLQSGSVPKIYWYGPAGENQALVMELLGPSLETIIKNYNQRFSIPTTGMLGCQMIKLLKFIHSKSFIHRDVKPDNFVIGLGENKDIVHIIDFGLSKRYRDSNSKLHIPYRDNKSLTGTVRYASINTHIGVEQSRRDDIESLIYVLTYFAKGSLPWQGLKSSNEHSKFTMIMECKMSTPIEYLCKGIPKVFSSALYYARGLKFEEKPNYKHLYNEFSKLLPPDYVSYRLIFEAAPTAAYLLVIV